MGWHQVQRSGLRLRNLDHLILSKWLGSFGFLSPEEIHEAEFETIIDQENIGHLADSPLVHDQVRFLYINGSNGINGRRPHDVVDLWYI